MQSCLEITKKYLARRSAKLKGNQTSPGLATRLSALSMGEQEAAGSEPHTREAGQT